jgi:hypothetical protein
LNNQNISNDNKANNSNMNNSLEINSSGSNVNSNSNVCKENSIIDKNLRQVYLIMFFLDYDVDHNNYEPPGKLNWRSETFSLS